MKAAAIITAGGVGNRMGANQPKQFLHLAGEPILLRTIKTFVSTHLFEIIIVTTPAPYLQQTQKLLAQGNLPKYLLLEGGTTRQDSVEIGLLALPKKIDLVMVHDGVRPLVSGEIIKNCLTEAHKCGAAITAIPVQDTIKLSRGNYISRTIDRRDLWRAQTPQAAKVNLLKQAYDLAATKKFIGTDEASLLELLGCQINIVEGSERNIKITVNEDLEMAETLLKNGNKLRKRPYIIGHGYDAHRLIEGRKLIMGGVHIPHNTGLMGHSDADVVSHALCDALLGALGQGDIGRHFPDSNPQYKGINSLELLKEVVNMATNQNYELNNADLTIIAQQPKLASFLPQMQENLANICQVDNFAINLKATTTEKMGFTGRQEGISCHAVALLSHN